MNRIITVVLIALGTLLLADEGHAVSINGELYFEAYEPAATRVGSEVTIKFPNLMTVDYGSGDYAGLEGTGVMFSTIVFDQNTFEFTPQDPTSVFSFGVGTLTYSFTLSNMTEGFYLGRTSSVLFQAEGFATISDSAGLFNRDATLGVFEVSSVGAVKFQAYAGASGGTVSVPDGGPTALLLGIAFLGLGAVSRRNLSMSV